MADIKVIKKSYRPLRAGLLFHAPAMKMQMPLSK